MDIIYRDPKTGREQTVGEWETTKQRLLVDRCGWVRKEPEEPLEPSQDTPLPDDLPGRPALMEAGVSSVEALTACLDVTDIDGIGQVTAHRISVYLEEIAADG